MLRNLLFVGILIVAASAPILMSKVDSNGNNSSFLSNLFPDSIVSFEETKTNAQFDPSSDLSLKEFKIDDQLASLLKPPQPDPRSVVETVVIPIPEAFRFDITPSFVSQNWPRVSTQLSDLNLSGMRVPLITGTSPQDLHGSITYFFNGSHHLQRIQLRGFAGSVESTVQFIQAQFKLQEYASNGARLYLSHLGNRPISMMRVRNAPVVSTVVPNSQQEIFVEINAPTEGATLSADSARFLYKMREANLL